MDNPLISPPLSFPTQLHRLETLNLTAQTNILLAQAALKEYIETARQMRRNMEDTERDIMDRAVRLRSSR